MSMSMRRLFMALLVLFGLGAGASSAVYAQTGPVYQILKASDSRVWRLNTQTGEISVCSLTGEQLLCSSSAQAIIPPRQSYAELEAQREAQQQAETERREERRRRGLAIVNVMMSTFKQLATLDVPGAEAN